jgi:hypothetical protein
VTIRAGGARRRPAAWLLVLGVLPVLADAAFVRANCRGIQKFSTTENTVSCQESNVLTDDADNLMLGHTRAEASLPRGMLSISAAGGQIRDVGANGGEAGALLKGRLILGGEWKGAVSVGLRLCVSYRFAGFGESRIHATLRTSAARGATGENQARVRLRHRGFGGTVLTDFESRGRFDIPADGPRPPGATIALRVTEEVHRDSPELNVRADIAAFALPNLEPLEPVLSSFAEVVAWIVVTVPDAVELSSQSGAFLSEPFRDQAAGTRRSWVIMKAAFEGGSHALRGHRDWHRAVARADCGHQLVLDG